MNKIIPIFKKARKKLRLARYPALPRRHSAWLRFCSVASLLVGGLVAPGTSVCEVLLLSDTRQMRRIRSDFTGRLHGGDPVCWSQ
jgi:hypothetical protein